MGGGSACLAVLGACDSRAANDATRSLLSTYLVVLADGIFADPTMPLDGPSLVGKLKPLVAALAIAHASAPYAARHNVHKGVKAQQDCRGPGGSGVGGFFCGMFCGWGSQRKTCPPSFRNPIKTFPF